MTVAVDAMDAHRAMLLELARGADEKRIDGAAGGGAPARLNRVPYRNNPAAPAVVARCQPSLAPWAAPRRSPPRS